MDKSEIEARKQMRNFQTELLEAVQDFLCWVENNVPEESVLPKKYTAWAERMIEYIESDQPETNDESGK